MSILIVSKTTAYEEMGPVLAGRLTKQTSMGDDRIKRGHDEHRQCLERLEQELTRAKLSYDKIQRDAVLPPGKAYRVVIAVGGDGTLLVASHKLHGDEFLVGINSSSLSVGYLCAADITTIPSLVALIRDQKTPVIQVQRLQAKITRAKDSKVDTSMPAMNDILYAHKHPAGTTRYQISFAGRIERQKSSGIWFSTAAGSTASMFAAGGKKQELGDRRYQFKVRELYKVDEPELRLEHDFFEPESQPLVIENGSREAILALDGQYGQMSVGFGDMIEFMRAQPVKLCHQLKS